MSLLSSEPINIPDVQIYIDTLPSYNLIGSPTLNQPDRNSKRKDEKDSNEMGAFNPNKTFGGERPRFANMNSFDESGEFRRESLREESMRIKTQQNSTQIYSNSVLDSLKKLLRGI